MPMQCLSMLKHVSILGASTQWFASNLVKADNHSMMSCGTRGPGDSVSMAHETLVNALGDMRMWAGNAAETKELMYKMLKNRSHIQEQAANHSVRSAFSVLLTLQAASNGHAVTDHCTHRFHAQKEDECMVKSGVSK